MHQKSAAASTVSKEFIETYCRTLEELEKCRGKITRLSQENGILVQKLEEYDWNRECHRKEMQAEKQFRERFDNDTAINFFSSYILTMIHTFINYL